MAGKVFFSVSMSLDGFIAPESSEELMGRQWMELQRWIFPTRFFRENLTIGKGGEEGRDNDIVRETYLRTGVSVMGKRMFDAGERYAGCTSRISLERARSSSVRDVMPSLA